MMPSRKTETDMTSWLKAALDRIQTRTVQIAARVVSAWSRSCSGGTKPHVVHETSCNVERTWFLLQDGLLQNMVFYWDYVLQANQE